MKETGMSHWKYLNVGADNSSGFTALPAGMYFEGSFQHIYTTVEYWSSTESYGPYAWYRVLYNYNAECSRTNWYEKFTARSVRCVLND